MSEVYFNGGIGDAFVLESYLPETPSRIYWACRARPDCVALFQIVHPEIEHINLWADRDLADERYFYADPKQKVQYCPCPEGVEDWGVFRRFPEIRRGKHRFRGSTFLKHTLADVSHFDLPDPYVVIQADSPYNSVTDRASRRLKPAEWDYLLRRLTREKRYGVVVDCERADPPPTHDRIIDLVGKTTMAQTIEILKGAVGFYGIDSCLAQLAHQLFDPRHLLVKWGTSFYWVWKDIYCSPRKTYDHLTQSFAPEPRPPKVEQALGLDPVEVLLTRPRLVGTTIHNKGDLVVVPANTARALIAHGSAVCWQSRKEEICTNANKLADIIASRSSDD